MKKKDEEIFSAKITMKKEGIAWNQSFSPYDYKLSEVRSALFKEIRRGKEEMASFWAYQLMISGDEVEKFFWEELKIISIEDCGLANKKALIVISHAKDLYYDLPPQSKARFMVGNYAVIYLARSKKTRYTTELFQIVRQRLHEESWRPEIPDYALDMHLPRARTELKRGLYHYLKEGAKLVNEDKRFSKKYREKLLKKAKKQQEG